MRTESGVLAFPRSLPLIQCRASSFGVNDNGHGYRSAIRLVDIVEYGIMQCTLSVLA